MTWHLWPAPLKKRPTSLFQVTLGHVPEQMRVLALLCALGAARALDETCSTLWSKLAHLGCRPQDQPLRDHLDTLTLADGGVVTLRCTEGHELCYRTDHATELSQQPPLLALTPEPFSSVAHSARTAPAAAAAAAADRGGGGAGRWRECGGRGARFGLARMY